MPETTLFHHLRQRDALERLFCGYGALLAGIFILVTINLIRSGDFYMRQTTIYNQTGNISLLLCIMAALLITASACSRRRIYPIGAIVVAMGIMAASGLTIFPTLKHNWVEYLLFFVLLGWYGGMFLLPPRNPALASPESSSPDLNHPPKPCTLPAH